MQVMQQYRHVGLHNAVNEAGMLFYKSG